MWICLRDCAFSRFDTIPACDGRIDRSHVSIDIFSERKYCKLSPTDGTGDRSVRSVSLAILIESDALIILYVVARLL